MRPAASGHQVSTAGRSAMAVRLRTLPALGLALALLAGALPARALAVPADVTATRAYIEADYAFARASVALIGPAQAKIKRFEGELAERCPRVAGVAPQDEASQPMSYEVAAALWSVAYGTAVGPARTFRAKVSALHWRNPALTAAVHAYANSLYELASIPLPDLCTDVAAWKASGYREIPASALALDARVEAIEPKPVPARLLAPSEQGADMGLLARIARLESRVAENEFVVGQADWFRTLAILGLNE